MKITKIKVGPKISITYDEELMNLIKEAEMYIQCKRGEINLFEEE